MATISLCMIVKNEENVLKRCLDSICDLVDEIVIVDTGSTDSTKAIASSYTDNLYDFCWINDFSAARNYSFSKCSMDYIYVADADEYLDAENRTQFKLLKENLYPEIEIVQMMYETISHDTVLNINKEYRPKLFKRLREFVWINPVHETVRLDPLVFDSDIIVTHAPEGNHAGRDLSIFENAISSNGELSATLIKMYATELYRNGNYNDFTKAISFFMRTSEIPNDIISYDKIDFYEEEIYGVIIVAKWLRLGSDKRFEEFVLSVGENTEWPSELCFELGEYYLENRVYDKASESFNRAYNNSCYLDVHSGGDNALKRIIICIEQLITQYKEYEVSHGSDLKMTNLISEYSDILRKYKIELNNWKAPEQEVV